MSQPLIIPKFEDEEDFRAWYLKLGTAQEHILALQQWRLRQSKIVGSLGQIIGHFGGEQYTEVDHFLLELLQNADDNAYAPGVAPEMSITLESSRCIFACNETGFTADNVFAICYAAASTKKRDPGKRSFIGEKGIGFKSLFAVAEAVEIHSGDYHFELRDQEYIVPHLLQAPREPGSRIVVRFRTGMADIAGLLSKRIAGLSQNADHFVLFLQKLEKLTITDRMAGTTKTVDIIRDGDRCVVQQGTQLREYRMVSQTVPFPEEIVRDRFKHLSGQLERDVRFAVPYPKELTTNSSSGLLFCFLPTRVQSGFPFHIQVDGKTTTNRENIESSARSKWNKHLMEQIPLAILNLFLKLRDDQEFAQELPLYFPDPKKCLTGNDDLNQVLKIVIASIPNNYFAPDRKGEYQKVGALRSSPAAMTEWVETDQYEGCLGKYGDSEGQFLNPSWRKHAAILAQFGCSGLTTDQLAELFVKGGCPLPITTAPDEKLPRAFLDKWITLRPAQSWEVTKLKAAPIYPLKDGQSRRWGAITATTLLVSLDGREVPVPADSTILDPVFTYTPGGNVDEAIRGFNERFRAYLTSVLGMERYSDAKYLEDVFIPGVLAECEKPVTDEATCLGHTERWIELFNRVWWRQKTIIGDSSEERFRAMLRRIGACKVATKSKGQDGWTTIPLLEALLPQKWWQDQKLAAAYVEVGAPTIALTLQEAYAANVLKPGRSDPKFDLTEWTQFLLACGAGQGPRLHSTVLSDGDTLPKPVRDLWSRCYNIETNNRSPTITTTDFDPYTCQLLTEPQPLENLTVAVSRLWPSIASAATEVRWYYYSHRSSSVPDTAARCRIHQQLPLSSDRGLVLPGSAALDSDHNRAVGSGLMPLIPVARYESEEFLRYLGVQERLDEAWLEARAQVAMAAPSEDEFVEQAGMVMRIAARLAKYRPEGRTWIRTAKIFAHRIHRVLLSYDPWLAQKGDVGFPQTVSNEVLEALEAVTEISASALVEELFGLGDLAGHNAEIVAWLKAVGASLRTGRHNEITLTFANQLREKGLMFGSQKIQTLAELPVLWDVYPNPCSPKGFIILSEDQNERVLCELASQVIGWPRMTSKAATPVCPSLHEVEDVVRKQIQLAAEVLDKKFSGLPGNRPSNSPLMRLARQGRLKAFNASEITLTITECAEQPEVPFWSANDTLYFDSQQVSLPEALGRMIDAQAATTVAPFIEAIFDQQENAAKQEIARLRNPPKPTSTQPPGTSSGTTSPPNPSGSGAGGDGTTNPSNPGGTNPAGNGGSGNGSPPPPNPPSGARKRLYSYVSRKGDGKLQNKRQSSATTQAKTDVELAGEKLLQDFCTKHGLGCQDVTAEDKGYDFEIQTTNGSFMVELKSSRDQWQNWENAMTPNEFKSAIHHADNYVLCVAERVLDPQASLVFIQNPWGQADYFLFDSPWKHAASDPAQLFSILEDAPGAPPPRPEDP